MDSLDESDPPILDELTSEDSQMAKSSNPTVTTDIIEDLEKMKGDSIGDTLYSSRFVLRTLIRLMNYTSTSTLSDDEDFEKDLCILWDMTIQADVVHFLLHHNVLEIFTHIIHTNDVDKRLTEILVGIIGNMCSERETRSQLCMNNELMPPLLDLVSCSDSLILIQFMRLLHAAVVFENSGDECFWFHHFTSCENFVEKLSYVLENSMNVNLLAHTYEALNSICTKFAFLPKDELEEFLEMFIRPCLISGVLEAFNVMLPARIDKSTDEELQLQPSKNSQRIMSLFLDIIVQLSYSHYQETFRDYLVDIFKCISRILDPLCNENYLFPIMSNERGYIEEISDFFQHMGDPFHGEILNKLITIRSMVGQKKSTDDFEDLDPENNIDECDMTLLELLARICKNGSVDEIAEHVKSLSMDKVVSLFNALKAGDSEPDIHKSCTTLGAVIKKLWDVDVADKNSL